MVLSRPDGKVAALRRLPFFSGARHGELERLARLTELHAVAAGTVVQRQGERVRHWLHVVEGTVLRSRQGRPTGLLGPGASWGAPLLAGRRPSPETLDALEPATLLWIEARSWATVAEAFPALAEQYPALASAGSPAGDGAESHRPDGPPAAVELELLRP